MFIVGKHPTNKTMVQGFFQLLILWRFKRLVSLTFCMDQTLRITGNDCGSFCRWTCAMGFDYGALCWWRCHLAAKRPKVFHPKTTVFCDSFVGSFSLLPNFLPNLRVHSEVSRSYKVHEHANRRGVEAFGPQHASKSDNWDFSLSQQSNSQETRNAMKHNPMLRNTAVEVLFGVLSALIHLHALQIVHRDVKSENVEASAFWRKTRMVCVIFLRWKATMKSDGNAEVMIHTDHAVLVDSASEASEGLGRWRAKRLKSDIKFWAMSGIAS